SDQYSFCVALWEALHGELPNWRRTAPDRTPAPPWLLRALRRGLALDRADRFPTMDALLAALSAGLEPPPRRPLAVAALAAALGAGAGAALQAGTNADACAAPSALADALWPADQREALRAAGPSGVSLETWLSEHVFEYASARAAVCEAEGRWDEAARARASRCLDEREQALRAIAAAVAPATSALLGPEAAQAWDGRLALWDRALPPASDCVDPR